MIERFASGGPYEALIGYSRVVRAGETVLTAGCTSVVDGVFEHEGDPHGQALAAFHVGLSALAVAGCRREAVIQTRMYITDRAHADDVGRAHYDLFHDVRPVATMVVVAGLLDPRMLVEVELVGRVET